MKNMAFNETTYRKAFKPREIFEQIFICNTFNFTSMHCRKLEFSKSQADWPNLKSVLEFIHRENSINVQVRCILRKYNVCWEHFLWLKKESITTREKLQLWGDITIYPLWQFCQQVLILHDFLSAYRPLLVWMFQVIQIIELPENNRCEILCGKLGHIIQLFYFIWSFIQFLLILSAILFWAVEYFLVM